MSVTRCALLGLISLGLVACASSAVVPGANSYGRPAVESQALSPGKYIKHVVIVIQENRTFENIFAGFPGADAPMYGYIHTGVKVPLKPATFNGPDLPHGWSTAMVDWNNGKMNGFDLSTGRIGVEGLHPYVYLQRSLVAPYWAMAQQYVLADRMFPTEFGASFTSHVDLVAGTANLSPSLAEVNWPNNIPWGCDAPPGTVTSTLTTKRIVNVNAGPFPCFTQFRTMADTLDAAGISWKHYQSFSGAWSAFRAIKNVFNGPDWKSHVVAPPYAILTDAANGRLPDVSWVVPSVANSDHPGSNSNTGPSWVASVVNAIGSGPDWNTTAIVVLWDDWGGFYDNVNPPRRDFVGLGIRVPCIIISPYVRPHVSSTVYEFGSVLKFVEQVFTLPPLGPASFGYTDTRAHSIIDSFDFTQAPRKFKKIAAAYRASYFLTQPESLAPPDDPE